MESTKAYKIKFQRVTENEVVIEANSQQEALLKFEIGDFFGDRETDDLGQEVVMVEESEDSPSHQLTFGF